MTSSSTPSNSSAGSVSSPSISKDLLAGFLVSLLALPLCLGIAMASGFPPAAGLLTAIVGGVVVNFLGSAQLTIKGPALGLILIALGAVTELGQGDMVAGYRCALAVGVVAALIQIGLALVRATRLVAAIPPGVVYGMLAALGISVIATQAHAVLGVAPQNQAILALLLEIPSSVAHAEPAVAVIGLLSVLILFALPLLRGRIASLAKLPTALLVLLLAAALGFVFDLDQAHYARALGSEYWVHLPGSLLAALAFPDFSQLGSATSIKYIVMFALVGSIQSTVNVSAVDTIDPAKRVSKRDRDLLVVGLGNLLSSALGGLPMISGLVRSRANVEAGASSRFANFFHGLFLLGLFALVPIVLQYVPLAALAALLVHAASQLVTPAQLRQMNELGWAQLVLFAVALLLTLFGDPLLGVGVGVLAHLVLTLAGSSPLATRWRTDRRGDAAQQSSGPDAKPPDAD